MNVKAQSVEQKTWICLGLLCASAALSIFIVKRWARKENRPLFRGIGKRRSDTMKIEKEMRVDYFQAERLKSEGNPNAAAKLLEKIGMVREAIETLEQANSFRDAADILIRMGLPERAGALLERNEKWEEAIECFHLMNSRDDILRCSMAQCLARGFQNPLRIEAEALGALREYLPAARAFLICDEPISAYRNFILAAEYGDIQASDLDVTELRFIAQQMGASRLNHKLLSLLKLQDMLQPLLVKLLQAGSRRNIAFVLKHEFRDPATRMLLLNEPKLKEPEFLLLAEVLVEISDFTLAAAAFAKVGRHEDAGRAAEIAQHYALASASYERGGLFRKASEMRVLDMQKNSEAKRNPGDPSVLVDITRNLQDGERLDSIANAK